MTKLWEISLYERFCAEKTGCTYAEAEYAKSDCIFTDWLNSLGEITDSTSSAVIVVSHLAHRDKSRELPREEEDSLKNHYREWLKKFLQKSKGLPKVEFLGKSYVLLCSSAGLIKVASFYYIRSDLYTKANAFVWAGLAPFKAKLVPNKWLVYPGLLFSTAKVLPWSINYDRIAVLPDVFTTVKAAVKRLSFDGNIPSLAKQTEEFRQNISDGLVIHLIDEDVGNAFVNQKEMEDFIAKKILGARTIRQFFCKGLAIDLPRSFFTKVVESATKNSKPMGLTEESPVTDIFGVPHSLKDIDIIMFESVFKMGSIYKAQFGEKGYRIWAEHCRKYNPCFWECVGEHTSKNNKLSPQVMQTIIGMTNEDIKELEEFRNVLYKFNTAKGCALNLGKELGRAAELFPAIMATPYCKELLAETYSAKFRKVAAGNIYLGKSAANLFVAIDPVAVIQGIVGGDILGCLKEGEVYAPNERADEMVLIRYPHPNNNLVVVRNRHVNLPGLGLNVIFCSAHDLSAIILKMDYDGDHLLVVSNPKMVELAKRHNQTVGQMPIVWDSPKGEKVICSKKVILSKIEQITEGNPVGIYSDTLTRMWNFLTTEEILENEAYFASLEMAVNEIIDSMKGGAELGKMAAKIISLLWISQIPEAKSRCYRKCSNADEMSAWFNKQTNLFAIGKRLPINKTRGNLNKIAGYVLENYLWPNHVAKNGALQHTEDRYWKWPKDMPAEFRTAIDGSFMFDNSLPIKRAKGLVLSAKNIVKDEHGEAVLSDTGYVQHDCFFGNLADQSAADYKREIAMVDKNTPEGAQLLQSMQENRFFVDKQRIIEWFNSEKCSYMLLDENGNRRWIEWKECVSVIAMHLFYFRGSEKFPQQWFRYFWQVCGETEVAILTKNAEAFKAGNFPVSDLIVNYGDEDSDEEIEDDQDDEDSWMWEE